MRGDNLQSFSDPGTGAQRWRRATGVVATPIPLLIEHTSTV